MQSTGGSAGKRWSVHLYAVSGLLGTFCLASGGIYVLARVLSHRISGGNNSYVPPTRTSVDGERGLYFPSSLEELKDVAGKLQSFKEENWYSVLGFFAVAYLYKQSFAIPGSFFLNILSGALFGLGVGLTLVSVLSAAGASCCYLLSRTFGRDLVVTRFSQHIRPLQDKLNEDNGSLLFLLISLRVLPMTPNWLLNILSPILGVPLHLFFFSVLVGLILSQLQSLTVLDPYSILSLLVATVSLLAVALALRRCRTKSKTS